MKGTLYGLFQKRLSPAQRRLAYKLGLSAWPPFAAAGIRVADVGRDLRSFRVELKARPWNRNYFGTHFGGALYAMCDPFYVFLVIDALGPDFIVWDKAATIRFKKPGKGTVTAEFHLSQEQIDSLKAELETKEKFEVTYGVQVKDASGEVVAEVDKLIYVRRKAPLLSYSRPASKKPLRRSNTR